MRVALTHNAVGQDASADERDVLVQVEAVRGALERLGCEAFTLPCGLDLEDLRRKLERERPEAAFNLVESLGGHGRLIHLVPSLLDALGLPYTGSGAEAMFLTSNKTLAKERLRAAGLPTPPWIGPFTAGRNHDRRGPADVPEARAFVVKSVWEHASVGLGEGAILPGDRPDLLLERLRRSAGALGGAAFGEAFIEGREFNLSLLASPEGPEALPPAEIDFSAYPEGKARIVCYRAKWEEDSFEYNHTPRRFDFPPEDRGLLEELKSLAKAAWELFDLGGYARVDFRVDAAGRPWILEINANPCISPDAGFAAALERAGIPYEEAVRRILADALKG